MLYNDFVNVGTVYWFTGLSGSGKTAIGSEFFALVRAKKPHAVFLDGDVLRKTIADDLGFTLEERKKCAKRYGQLCKILSQQGIDVVCATICMFPECWEWNRKHLSSYKEIYIRVPLNTVKKRDSKGLYSGVSSGVLSNVVGVDVPAFEPDSPHFVVDNDGVRTPTAIASEIHSFFEL